MVLTCGDGNGGSGCCAIGGDNDCGGGGDISGGGSGIEIVAVVGGLLITEQYVKAFTTRKRGICCVYECPRRV